MELTRGSRSDVGAVLLVALPRGLGDLLLGEIWGPTYPLVPLITLAFMGGSIQGAAGAGLHALGAARRSLRVMILSSVLVVACGLGGASLGRNRRDCARCGSRGMDWRAAVVVATPLGAAGVSERFRAGPESVAVSPVKQSRC